ncbi:hypothetical protein NTH_00746 [Nitratireductor thuwali]|uniref:Extensin-like C-terminal domain-containing protein n=2 Tax=Nitratireductor thuwali TaxID=2267699 RepID=A0ABY5MK89_9HYPH|nr:hypothetical protein NTH_00746 [Nitratireductor thuwali]
MRVLSVRGKYSVLRLRGIPRRLMPAARHARKIFMFSGLLLISSCSVDTVMRPDVDVGMHTATVGGGGLQNLVPSNPMMMSYPRIRLPQSPSAVMPADEVSCRRQLKRLGVTFRNLAPIDDGGACRIDHPVEVSGLSGGIDMKPAATLTCDMALTVARWTKNELAPAARMRYLSGIGTIHQGSSYSCRRIRGTSVASEHSKGNALDIMRITLKNGNDIDVRRPGFFAFRQKSLLNKVRAQGCDYFTTVLGPGYDADHKDHFHFDIKDRRNGYRACR